MFNLNHRISNSPIQFIINLLKFCDLSKAGGKDNLSGRFLKDGADVLVIEIT